MTFFIQKFFLTSKENTLIQFNRLTSKYGKSDTEVFVFFLITAKKIWQKEIFLIPFFYKLCWGNYGIEINIWH